MVRASADRVYGSPPMKKRRGSRRLGACAGLGGCGRSSSSSLRSRAGCAGKGAVPLARLGASSFATRTRAHGSDVENLTTRTSGSKSGSRRRAERRSCDDPCRGPGRGHQPALRTSGVRDRGRRSSRQTSRHRPDASLSGRPTTASSRIAAGDFDRDQSRQAPPVSSAGISNIPAGAEPRRRGRRADRDAAVLEHRHRQLANP